MSVGAPKLINPKSRSVASEFMSLGAPLPPLLINLRAASYSIFLKPDESVFCFSNRFFPCWGWVGGDYGYWTYQRSMPPLRIVHWLSVLHLRKTTATSEEVIPNRCSNCSCQAKWRGGTCCQYFRVYSLFTQCSPLDCRLP